ncbi:MAG TPA: GntR family transcriptional regulator [Candidatus Limnocylindrales bacterium]
MSASTDGALELRSLQRQIHDQLLGRILRRELEPGERISPPEIAAALGVSITPVRDAVNQMAAEGLVTVTPRRGTVVSPVSIRDIEELYEIRLMIEPDAAELAASRATVEEIAGVQELAERLESGPAGGATGVDDLETYLQEIATDAELHAAVVRAAHNQRLDTLYSGLRTHVLIARAVFPRLYRGQPHRRGEHQRVVDAIAAHDGRAAGEAMTAHLRQALADTLHHVETSEGRAPAEPASSS